MTYRKKQIEVALPLKESYIATARQKSIPDGHLICTQPLGSFAKCRAVPCL